ncbi:preprotein translocase subunit SecG [Treponema sp.]|uniref:preprotein translocase subunit SecG n=1 Tax=Treponema sp. TaxID=166 RepID=UPI0025F12B78|nr:preprotein translocase subunit SecG [Treponema sp.]MCR5218790.1 preprotein translocase subunit SecG [Treponema sp.]
MDIVKAILVAAFVIVCILLVLLVLVQNEDSNGMGSAFGGGASTAFGAHGASVLTKTTGVLVVLFFVITIGIALINAKFGAKKSADDLAGKEAAESTAAETSEDADWDTLLGDGAAAETTEAAVETPAAE